MLTRIWPASSFLPSSASGTNLPPVTKLSARQGAERELIISVDPSVHEDFGLSYPVTYRVCIPRGGTGLRAHKRHSPSADWVSLPVMTSRDFFNGVEAVRFDYRRGIAYVSVAFSPASDDIALKIVDSSAKQVEIQFGGICRYYDNRRGAVVVTADDWADVTNHEFVKAVHTLRSCRIPVTTAVITGLCSEQTWQTIQQELDSGYVEVASHSRSHPKLPYADPASEIIGSSEDILARLRLPATFRKGSRQYVYTWVAPYGSTDTRNEEMVSRAGYLVDRITDASSGTFTAWNSLQRRYMSDGVTLEMGPLYGGITSFSTLNRQFDAALDRGNIYHIMIHPHDLAATDEWSKPYISRHLSHISNRTDVWYVNFGMLYLYHILQDHEAGLRPIEDGTLVMRHESTNQRVSVG